MKQLYQKYERWVPLIAFVGGFLFDAVMLTRIDEPAVIVQQAAYILLAAFLIGVELIEEAHGEIHVPKYFGNVWRYREFVLHFMLGTLLNSYAIFYFKSASAIRSLFFIGLLFVLLTINEFKRFGRAQTQVHIALLSLSIVSYFVSLVPILLGFVGSIPFLAAVTISVALFAVYVRLLKPKLVARSNMLRTHLFYPFAAIMIAFVGLYFAHAIPPVPLSVKYMGIFHQVDKTEGGYRLVYNRPAWKFWQNGDQTFQFRAGDVAHCYAQVFSPTRFKDRLQVRWLYHSEKQGWQSSDVIPVAVVGGREEGFRLVTKKSNLVPGAWRVQIETLDSHEVGRIRFDVVADSDPSQPREEYIVLKE